MLELHEYVDAKGGSPFGDWFDDLDPVAAAKVTVGLGRIEQGNLSGVMGVGRGVLGYRIYFGRDGDVLIILLGGGTKKRQ